MHNVLHIFGLMNNLDKPVQAATPVILSSQIRPIYTGIDFLALAAERQYSTQLINYAGSLERLY